MIFLETSSSCAGFPPTLRPFALIHRLCQSNGLAASESVASRAKNYGIQLLGLREAPCRRIGWGSSSGEAAQADLLIGSPGFMTVPELRNFVNGDYVDSRSDARLDLIDPATEAVYATSPVSTADDVDGAYSAT